MPSPQMPGGVEHEDFDEIIKKHGEASSSQMPKGGKQIVRVQATGLSLLGISVPLRYHLRCRKALSTLTT